MKMIYEPKIELTNDEVNAIEKILALFEQIYQEGVAPIDNDAQNLQLHICDFCETYVADWE